jgi:hypothetical protein
VARGKFVIISQKGVKPKENVLLIKNIALSKITYFWKCVFLKF